MRAQAAQVACNPLAAVEDLNGRDGDARLDLLAQQLVRYALVMLGDLDMLVEANPAAPPPECARYNLGSRLPVVTGMGKAGVVARSFP
jgi:hypothetical protein